MTRNEDVVWAEIDKTFSVLQTLTEKCCEGSIRSLIVYGPPGLGKSFTVEKVLTRYNIPDENVISGTSTKVGLLRSLYRCRFPGQVVVFDDCDSVLQDEQCISLLKAALDSSDTRRISYLSNAVIYPEDDELNPIPSTFEFEGTVIFITNQDFENCPKKIKPHCDALLSRSLYLDLRMKTKIDYFIRIKQVVALGLFDKIGLSEDEIVDVVKYIRENLDSMRELSVRMAFHLGTLRKSIGDDWREFADRSVRRQQ